MRPFIAALALTLSAVALHGQRAADRFRFLSPAIVAQDALNDALPPFGFHEEPLRHVASRGSTALGALALCVLLLGAFGVAQLRRYPVAS